MLFRSEIWPILGGKSHHLARSFGRISAAKQRFPLNFALSEMLARLLYG